MLILGMDTGGTYTDGVILNRDTKQVLCRAKALTTPENLAIGIENCIQKLPFSCWHEIEQVSLSTTLATNAIVEGNGCRVGLIVLGKRPQGRIPAEICVELDARVDIRGGIRERLDAAELDAALLSLRGRCDAVAVSGYASVRNPAHELQTAQRVREALGLPVVCGHELTAALGFYERTVTAVLNARLIPIIHRLIRAVKQVIAQRGIRAPVLVMRGDGSLMRADYAAERPVETILSGPAASVMGARFLSGRNDCLVVDMGGTTTDIACLKNGECEVSDEGAQLAGWRTKVRALKICTFGLGGDSAIHFQLDGTILVGPQRVIPICRAQDAGENTGLTPTDVLHAAGRYCVWDSARARTGIELAAERLAEPPERFVRKLQRVIAAQLAAYCREGIQNFGEETIPMLVGVGAPAKAWLTDAAQQIGMPVCIPPYAEVANAVGAAIGQIRESAQALIRPNRVNQTYLLYTGQERLRVQTLEEARRLGMQAIRTQAAQKAEHAGAAACSIQETVQEKRDEAGTLIEMRLHAVAAGYPKRKKEQ